MTLKKRWSLFAMMVGAALAISICLSAQEPIRGTLRSASGEPLSGATVTVKGTNITVITNENGQFTINAPAGSTLVVSSVGFQPREIAVSGSEINETLQASDSTLGEVVVIGYQTVRRRDLTGATGIVSTENTERLVSRSLPEQLQGMSPGVTVRTGGQPGQEAVINIRGLSTINGNANPLFVIDGMIADPNTTVNPNDVASIQVLKDASAAAIYGSRAGNGVIIITTKKGREGPMRVSASARYGISKIPERYDMMSGPEYVAMNKAAYEAAGYALQPAVANYNGTNTNWADEALRTGSVQDYNVTLSGGNAGANYLFSGSYFKDVGTLIARDFERAALRMNSEATRGRFKFGENLMFSNSLRRAPYENNFEVGNPWYDIWNSLPIIPVQDPALVSVANPGGWGYGSPEARSFSRNPVAIADITSVKTSFFKILGNAYMDFRFTNWLNYRFNAGLETSFDRAQSLRKDGPWYWNQSPKPSEVGETRTQFLSYLFDHTLNFNKKWDRHAINGVLGYTAQTIRADSSLANRTGLNPYGQTTIGSAGVNGASFAAGGNRQVLISSLLGRVNYNYAEKYLASFTFRQDKDSRFSDKYRTAFFPSAAVAWNIHNEDFFKVPALSTFKLRASYGVLGLANLNAYQYIAFLNQAPRAVFGPNQQEFPGATQARLVFEDLRWEEKKITNIGIDAGLLNNRLTITLDAFRSVTDDILVAQPLPRYLGNLQGDPLVNIGSIQNKGIELEVGYAAPQTAGFNWSLSGNISVIRNKLLSLGNLGIDESTGQPRNYIQSGNTRSQVGRSIGEYYVIKTDGIFQSQREIDEQGAQKRFAKAGDIRYVNIVNGGTDDDINDLDRQFAGSPWPELTTGLQFNASYHNFSLNLQLYGAFGQKLYNDVRRDLDAMGYSNYRKGINPWTTSNTNTDFPRLGVSYVTGVPGDPGVDQGIVSNVRGNTDRWIEDGSYLRLRNVEIGYTLPRQWISRIALQDARLFVGAQNLLTFTKYSGLDPDVVGANAVLEPGVDNGNYPASRIITFGLNIGF